MCYKFHYPNAADFGHGAVVKMLKYEILFCSISQLPKVLYLRRQLRQFLRKSYNTIWDFRFHPSGCHLKILIVPLGGEHCSKLHLFIN